MLSWAVPRSLLYCLTSCTSASAAISGFRFRLRLHLQLCLKINLSESHKTISICRYIVVNACTIFDINMCMCQALYVCVCVMREEGKGETDQPLAANRKTSNNSAKPQRVRSMAATMRESRTARVANESSSSSRATTSTSLSQSGKVRIFMHI